MSTLSSLKYQDSNVKMGLQIPKTLNIFLLQEVNCSTINQHECTALYVEIPKWYKWQVDFRVLIELHVTKFA